MNPQTKKTPEEIAEATCNYLLEEFPDLEIQHHDPEDFFDGYFCDAGMPFGPEYYPINFEMGRVINLEAKGFYDWSPADFEFHESAERDSFYSVVLFIHEDGFVAQIDDYSGHMHKLFKTPEAPLLAEYIKLYFEQGRQQLRDRNTQPAKIEQLYVPYFQFPDDFVTDYTRMPIVPIEHVEKQLKEHIEKGTPWLHAMEDLQPQINKLIREIEEEEPEFSKPARYDFDDEDKGMTFTGKEFVLGMFMNGQKERENARPDLIKQARDIPSDCFIEQPDSVNFIYWSFPYYHLGGPLDWPQTYLPLIIEVSGPFFNKSMDPQLSPKHFDRVFSIIQKIYWGDPDYKLPLSVEMPGYLEQVSGSFRQEVMIYQAPLLAAKAMRMTTKDTGDMDQCLQKRLDICKALKEYTDKNA